MSKPLWNRRLVEGQGVDAVSAEQADALECALVQRFEMRNWQCARAALDRPTLPFKARENQCCAEMVAPTDLIGGYEQERIAGSATLAVAGIFWGGGRTVRFAKAMIRKRIWLALPNLTKVPFSLFQPNR